MSTYEYKNINSIIKQTPTKKCWNIGSNTVVVIDKEIVKRLSINEENTLFEEVLIDDDAILLRIKRMG